MFVTSLCERCCPPNAPSSPAALLLLFGCSLIIYRVYPGNAPRRILTEVREPVLKPMRHHHRIAALDLLGGAAEMQRLAVAAL